MELGGPQDRPAEPRILDHLLDLPLDPVVAERHPVHADDRDMDRMGDTGLFRGLDEMSGRRVVATARLRGAVHDRVRAVDRRAQARTVAQIDGTRL